MYIVRDIKGKIKHKNIMQLGRRLKSHVGLQVRYLSITHAANNPVGTEADRHN